MGTSKIRVDGIVDVSIIVLSHCENPAKNEAIDFLEEVLIGNIKAIIPVSSFIGAYHIMTRYLRIDPEEVAKELCDTLTLRVEEAFYEGLSVDTAIEAIMTAQKYNVEG